MMRSVSALIVLAALLACAPNGQPGGARAGTVASRGDIPDTLVSADSALAALRREMVRTQIEARGVRDTAVLRAMREVPRHLFVPEVAPALAYSDGALPISHGQTISQPYIVAFMAEAADIAPSERVLEIGAGSGYGAAVLSGLAAEVYTVEIIAELAERARLVLERTGCDNVQVMAGDGWKGWPEHAPFDAIVVTAAPPEIPSALVDQLAPDGVLVVPVGRYYQTLQVLRKTPGGLVEEASLPVRFVPMVRPPGGSGG